MSRQLRSYLALLLICVTAVTGCAPTQPFFYHEDGDLSHYLDKATALEVADVEVVALDEVRHAAPPMTVNRHQEIVPWDLSLEEAIAIALQNSKVIRNLGSLTQFTISDGLVGRTAVASTVYDPAIFETDPQLGVEAALSAFDAQFSSNVFFQKTDRPVNTTFAFVGSIRDVGQFDAELSKRTATGTTFTMRNQTVYDQSNAAVRALASDWTTFFEAEATQPILRGRGTQVNRAPVIISRIRNDIALHDFQSSVRNMLADIENTYWDLHLAYRTLEAAKIGRDSALLTWRYVYTRKEFGSESAQQEAQSKEQFYFFRSTVETALRDVFNFETRLRWLMGLSPTDHRTIRPSDEPTIAKVEFEWDQVHQEAQFRYPELNRQKWVIKQREHELIIARNQLLPQLDLVASYRWVGVGDDLIHADRKGLNFPSPGSLAFDELTEGNYQESRIGLSFTPPRVGARREEAAIRNAKLNLIKDRAALEDMQLNVTHVLSTAIQNLEYNYKVATTHFNRWVAASQEVTAVDALYRGGTATLDLVLDAQRRRSQAQVDFYRSIIEYNKSIADVHFRKGTLLEYNGVQLAEGPWPKKAYWDALERARERDASYYLNYGWTRPKVVSQGEADGMQPVPLDGAEAIPTPEPTPALVPEESELVPPQPMSALPSGDEQILPATALLPVPDEDVRKPLDKFDWSSVRNNEPPAELVNPLRK